MSNTINYIKLKEALDCAFDICFLTKDTLGNIMAAEKEKEIDESDLENYNKADTFIKWYLETFKKK